ncbi:MAG: hypothetical protein A3F70_07710 [Acidobacteria bacterium RIFCSPLOWO2_12_FULL_67_14]|nr:MAG: hypothetical protein A3H29_14170 [Acidobacteria bacterium RIFCSPLOWO2_02_FULL_67_21]OFW35209.1 MAG: hypothetical protein A3F70_07710 [Acidobacteria bacterium RIFCSPLOWO2_12_FULL_67_14]
MHRLISTLAFGGSTAALVILIGTRAVESYDHAFFSLDRGTAAETVRVLGQPWRSGLASGRRCTATSARHRPRRSRAISRRHLRTG